MNRNTIGRRPIIVAEVLVALDVVLVAVGPVEIDFFPVVRDGVSLVAGVAWFGDEITFFVVAIKEGVQVIVDGGFDGVTGSGAVGNPGLGVSVFFAGRD